MNKLRLIVSIGLISGLFSTALSHASMTSSVKNTITSSITGSVNTSVFLEDYFTIRDVQVEEIHELHTFNRVKDIDNFEEIALFNFGGIIQDSVSTTSVASILLDNIINLGKKIWTLVEANHAVVSIATDRANALPQGISTWEHMQEWKTPSSRLFRVTYKNFFGMNVVDFTFRLIYTYGGSVNGKGLYLTQIGVIPADLLVRSGYTFNVHAFVPNITNAGTSESPMAAAEILVNWSLDNYAKHIEGSQSYYVRGDGYFEDMSGTLGPIKQVDATGKDLNLNTEPGSESQDNSEYPFSEDAYSFR